MKLVIILTILAAALIGYDVGAYTYSTVDSQQIAKQWITDNCEEIGNNNGQKWRECNE